MFEQFFTDYGEPVLGGALFIGAAWIVAWLLSKTLNYLLAHRLKLDSAVIALLSSVVSISIVVLAAIAVLEEIGVEIASLITALGIFGFAIAIGMRSTTTNFFNGVMIFILQPYKVGEYIEGERVEGFVESISVFHTVVVTDEGVYVAIPNGPMWARSVQNFSRTRPKRVEIELTLERTSAYSEVKLLIEQTLGAAMLADVPPTIAITDVTEKSIKIEVGFWCRADQTWELRAQISENLRRSLSAAGIGVTRVGVPKKKRPGASRKTALPPPASADEV